MITILFDAPESVRRDLATELGAYTDDFDLEVGLVKVSTSQSNAVQDLLRKYDCTIHGTQKVPV